MSLKLEAAGARENGGPVHLSRIPCRNPLGFRVSGWQGGDCGTGHERALVQRDESVPGRLLVRRDDGLASPARRIENDKQALVAALARDMSNHPAP
jgi:hypothetical protein